MKNNKIDSIYESVLTYENIVSVWNVVKKTCKNKKSIYSYHLHKNIFNYNLYQILLKREYHPFPFHLFLIFEPKARLVMSQTVMDKIVNHFVVKYYLIPYLENKLIDSNVATRTGKGSRYADKLMSDYINKIRIKEKNKEIYVLKIDISKYFYTISHEILMEKLEKEICDLDVLKIIQTIIDETDKPYINETISKINKKYNVCMPFYKKGVGLSIGAMTSQFLAIFFLNDLDHIIKEKLRCKYYIRYMDDFIILDTDKDRLKEIWKIIEDELTKLKLVINPKSSITSLSTGVVFLGYRYKIENHQYVIKCRSKTIKRIYKKLKLLSQHDLVKYYRSYSSYYGYLKKIQNRKGNFKMKTIEKYNVFKEKYPNSIVFVAEGSFYKTYGDDAVILWNLFQYTWNHNSISFGISNSSKVFDALKKQEIGYTVVDSNMDVIEVKGNDVIYTSYLTIAKVYYDNFEKKKNLHELLDKVLNSDKNYYEDVFYFLEKLIHS